MQKKRKRMGGWECRAVRMDCIAVPTCHRSINHLFRLPLFALLISASLCSEQELSLTYIPPTSYADPYGLTFELEGDGVAELKPGQARAFWIPAGESSERTDDRLAPYRTGTFLLHSGQGHFLHIRRVPGKPAKPDSRLLLLFHSEHGEPTYLYPDLPDDLKQKQVDVFLLIDQSLSMKRNDKLRLRVAAAKAFADLARGGGRIGKIGIVAFNHEAKLLLPPTDVISKEAIFEAADKIRNGGETDLDGAIELALREFEKLPDSEKVAILLTDGKDQPGVYENAHRLFADKKWPLHAIGLSKKADHETLQRIAKDTGGNYHDAPTSAELQHIFGDICFSLQNRTLIRQNTVGLQPGEGFKSNYAFDGSLKNVALTVSMNVPSGDRKNFTAQHTLTPPGATVEQILSAKGEGVWRYFDLWNPKPGNWSLSSSVSKSTETKIEATAITDLNLWHFPIQSVFEWGEPVSLFAGLAAENAAVTKADLTATVRFPDGTDKEFRYQVQDKLHALTLPDQIPTGDFHLHLRATGTNEEGGPFERELRASFNVLQTKPPRLWLSKRDLDFGQLYPGDSAQEDFQAKVITAEVLNRHPIKILELSLKTQDGTAVEKNGIEFAPLTTSSRELTTHQFKVRVPPAQKPGVYEGHLLLQHSLAAGQFEKKPEPARIALRVEVMPQTLIVEPMDIDFRAIQTGQTKRATLKLRLEPKGTVPLIVALERGEARVERDVELPPGVVLKQKVLLPIDPPASLSTQEILLALPLEVGRHTSPGTRRWNLRIKAGRKEAEIPIRFALQWPELNVSEEGIDFGRVFCGQNVERTLTFNHNSMHSEVVELLGLGTDAAKQAHLSGESSFRIEAVGSETERATRNIKLTLAPPNNATPGEYTGKLKLKTWFGQTEIPWKARIDVAKGFYVSNPLVTFSDVRPGTERTAEITVRSTIAKRQSISLRAQFSRLPDGLTIKAGPSRISLAPKRSARVTVTLKAEENAPAGSYSQSFQFRGPYNSASLQARAIVVPKRVEVIERPFELTLVDPMPPPPPSPPPTFGVFPPSVDIGGNFPGDTMLIELEIEGDFAQRVTLSHPVSQTLELDPITTITELSDNDSQIQTVLIRIPHTTDEGLQFSELTFTNGEQTQIVPISVMVEPPVIEPEPIVNVVETVAPVLPAPQPAKVVLPSWLRNLLWLLLILVALAVVIAALRWIFSIDVPEMTKFYLASGILHVVLALLCAVYYLEEKVIEIEDPERLNVQLVEKQESTPETVVEESEPIKSLDQKPIEVKKEETQTEQQPQETQETSESKTSAENSAESQEAKEVEVEKNTEESQTELAVAAADSSKADSAQQAEASEPQMKVQVRQAEDIETEKPEEQTEAEREIEKSERERVREENKPEEKEAEEVTPEKQDQPEETEIAEAEKQENPTNEAKTAEAVEAEAEPTEQKTEQADSKELETAEAEVAREESESTSEKATAESQPRETEAKEVEVEKSESEPAEVKVAKAENQENPTSEAKTAEAVEAEAEPTEQKTEQADSKEVESAEAEVARAESESTNEKATAESQPRETEAKEVEVEKSESEPAEVKVAKARSTSAPSESDLQSESVNVEVAETAPKSDASEQAEVSPESAAQASKAAADTQQAKSASATQQKAITASEVKVEKTDSAAQAEVNEAATGGANPASESKATASVQVQSPEVKSKSSSEPSLSPSQENAANAGRAARSSASEKKVTEAAEGSAAPREVQMAKTANQSAPSLSSDQTGGTTGSKSSAAAGSESAQVETPEVSQASADGQSLDIQEQSSGSPGQASQGAASESQKQVAVTEPGAQAPAQATGSSNIEQTSSPSLSSGQAGGTTGSKSSAAAGSESAQVETPAVSQASSGGQSLDIQQQSSGSPGQASQGAASGSQKQVAVTETGTQAPAQATGSANIEQTSAPSLSSGQTGGTAGSKSSATAGSDSAQAETPSVSQASAGGQSLEIQKSSGSPGQASQGAASGSQKQIAATETGTKAPAQATGSANIEQTSAPSLSTGQAGGTTGSKRSAAAGSESAQVETPAISQASGGGKSLEIQEQSSGSLGQASRGAASGGQKQVAMTGTGDQTPAQTTGSANIEQATEPSLAQGGGAQAEGRAAKGRPGIAESSAVSGVKAVQKSDGSGGGPTINVGKASQGQHASAPASQERQTAPAAQGDSGTGAGTSPTQRPSSGGPAGSSLASASSGQTGVAQASTAGSEKPNTTDGIGSIALKKETSGKSALGLTSGSPAGGSFSGADSGRAKRAARASSSGSGASSAKGTTGVPKAELEGEAQLAGRGGSGGSGRGHSSNRAEETTVAGGPTAKYVGGNSSESELDRQAGAATMARTSGGGDQSKTTRNAPRELAEKSRLANSSVLGPTRNHAKPSLYPAISSSGGKRGGSPDIETTAMANPGIPGEGQQVTGDPGEGEASGGLNIGATGTGSGFHQAAPGTGKAKLGKETGTVEGTARVGVGESRGNAAGLPGMVGTGGSGRGTGGLGTGSGAGEEISGGGPAVMVAKTEGGGGGLAPSKVAFGGRGAGRARGASRGKSTASRHATVQAPFSRLPFTPNTTSESTPQILNQDQTTNQPAFNPVPGRQMTEFTTFLASFGEFHGRTKFRKRQVGAMSFLKDEVERRLSFILSSKVETIPFSNRTKLMRAPWLFMTGEFRFEFSQAEATNLRDYLEGGGWLWIDDCSEETDNTFDRSVHEQIRLVLPDAEYGELPMKHPVFSSCYPLLEGYEGYAIPPGDKFRETRLHAYFIEGRPAIIYTRNDYGCGLEIDPEKGTAGQRSQTDLSPEQMREGALRMSMNMVFYFLGERGVQVERTRVVEEAEEEMSRRKAHEEKWRRLFVGGKLNDIEDFETDTAEEWIPSQWADTDVPEIGLIGADGRSKLDVKFEKNHDKSAFERDFGDAEKLDLSAAHAIMLDVNNQSTAIVRLAIALSTDGQEYIYHESPQVVLKPGMNRSVLFRLGKNFKTAPKWEYNQPLQGANDVRKMTFLIYAIKPGRLIFDNLRISTVKKADLVRFLQAGLKIQQKRADNVNDRE